MSKQILSVADFATILRLVNNEINRRKNTWISFADFYTREQKEKLEKEHIKMLENDPDYQSLLHLKDSIEKLNIEIETADISIKKGE